MDEYLAIKTATELIRVTVDGLQCDIQNGRFDPDVILKSLETIKTWNKRIQEANNG